MLSKSRCPHTGVVNFFTQADPLLSVGSVAEAGAPARYVWRCYVGEEACGLAAGHAARRRPACGARSPVASGNAAASSLARPRRATRPSRASSYWQKLNVAAAAAIALIGHRPSRVSTARQLVHAEIPAGVRPRARRLPAGAACERAELLERILVGVLGVDALPGRELE